LNKLYILSIPFLIYFIFTFFNPRKPIVRDNDKTDGVHTQNRLDQLVDDGDGGGRMGVDQRSEIEQKFVQEARHARPEHQFEECGKTVEDSVKQLEETSVRRIGAESAL
jgi:hypothetical protein